MNTNSVNFQAQISLPVAIDQTEQISPSVAKESANFRTDLSDKDIRGRTALHRAALNGQVKVVKLLVGEYGADVNAKDSEGWTPLYRAASSGHVEVMELLVSEFGADANVRTNSGSTPLHRAALSGHVKVVKLLVN